MGEGVPRQRRNHPRPTSRRLALLHTTIQARMDRRHDAWSAPVPWCFGVDRHLAHDRLAQDAFALPAAACSQTRLTRVALKSNRSSSAGSGGTMWPSEHAEPQPPADSADSAEGVGDVGRVAGAGVGRETVTTTGIGRELGLVVSLSWAARRAQLDAPPYFALEPELTARGPRGT